ncbi:MAG: transglutaminase family protein [Leptospiraceae bacterium]|nr:transglutaminase family protein [Leptospiraceae bacterium]MCP5498361.1 transglutaminase family protein [Leptospiraceae bacterium]
MSIRVALHHKTHYTYERPISLSPHIVRLRPAVHTRTPVSAYSFKVLPKDHFLNWQQDPYGNFQARLVFPEKTTEFKIEVDLIADMVVLNPFDFFLDEYSLHYPFKYDKLLQTELAPYLEIKEKGKFLKNYIKDIKIRKDIRTIDFLVELNQRLQKDIGYIIRMEPGVQTCEETLQKTTGSCRDSAWLLSQILRHFGLASRFVSGYLIQLASDVKSLDGPSGPENDFTDLHAWTEVYLPGAGWVGFDPTSGLLAGEGHIPLAATPEPASAAPVTGALEKAEVTFQFEMSVKRINEVPRVTYPYSEREWIRVNELGRRIDQDLLRNDVRLTMGGEPTFVSIDDMDGAEWNTEALGPTKKKYAIELFNRLEKVFARNPLLHFGQGKWYPGEALPRWALSCYWRKDGLPIWRNQELYGDERETYRYGHREAKLFMEVLTEYLCVHKKHVLPGFEDLYFYLWKEGTLPVNEDPFRRNLDDDFEREGLRKSLEAGLKKETGYTIPIRWNYGLGGWESGVWFLRRDRMYLLPGTSPMGYRLPLKSLPHSEKGFYEGELSSFADKAPLEDYYTRVQWRHKEFKEGNLSPSENIEEQIPENPDEIPDWLIRTALCVEPRDGRLYVFMPPLLYLEHYLDMLSCIEQTAEALNYRVIIEGYTPPPDPRIQKFSITPDPGVIEVNIQPAESWDELVRNTEILYEEARLSRLGTEKFMLDGRHTGTGGGNHITVGSTYPGNSPLLRKPHLLQSLIAYWLNHPSLSYLFSGLFIGPTSQAPRVDEARNDQVFELELAFKELEKQGENPPAWIIDRVLRNLLTDLTGNTHRAEFCIDKLYSPDGAQGRLGLLELRAYEMPPHAKMSTVQALLLRALISKFWQKPYRQKLVRYGTELHDKYMLPHFVWEDFKEVLIDLNQFGYEFDPLWFEAFYNFRFPLYGKVHYGDIRIELRSALEPWHVLGEESRTGGTARYVDSSAERLQVKVFGITNTRHILTCNGRTLPLHSTGTNGEYVAGVKYKAWSPASSLHPTIKSHNPIVIDLVDTWNEKSIGGCSYHVSHPGGRGYDIFPVNSNEAETRRISRFFPFGHTPGKVFIYPESVLPEFPYTLDLRH